jgi:hypothetical protein
MYETMENYAFDSYDPNAFNEYVAMGDSFEEAAGSSSPSMRSPRAGFRALGGVGQVDILLTNTITAAVSTIDTGGITRFDLFNYNRSGGLINNVAFSQRVIGSLSFEEYDSVGATSRGVLVGATATQIAHAKANKIIFGSDGSLYYTGAQVGATAVTEQLVISCRQLPYRNLLNSSQCAPFMVSKMRLTVPTNLAQASLQINQDFTHVTNTFLGAQKSNPISPRAFFNPNQFQTNIVDIKAAYSIDPERGLSYQVVNALSNAAAETTTVTLFVPAFEKPTSAKVFR